MGDRLTIADMEHELAFARSKLPEGLALRYGIGIRALRVVGGIGVANVTTHGPLYEPCTRELGGRPMVIMPVACTAHYECTDDIHDLVAFDPRKPDRWWLRRGVARCLGEWRLRNVRERTPIWQLPDDRPPVLRVFSDPLSWLRGNCRGATPLSPAWLEHLFGGLHLEAENLDHGVALQTALAWCPLSKVFVRQDAQARAA